MNFLFTVALNNDKTPDNYKTIMKLFCDLAITLEEMGNKTFIITHPDSCIKSDSYHNILEYKTFTTLDYQEIISKIGFKPDYSFIWNGNLTSDALTISILKDNNIKIIYGELGLIDHYNKTCYFDLSGVNCRISNISKTINVSDNLNYDEINDITTKQIKERLIHEPYIFVPLQVETDTQILNYSPFKTMDSLLQYVSDIFVNDDRKIVYKQHPHSKSNVSKYNKFEEVFDDVHHYIPYADIVIGINSTVLFETLLYHNRIISLGAGITSKHLETDLHRKQYVLDLYNKQLNWYDLKDKNKIENSQFYQEILKDYTKCMV